MKIELETRIFGDVCGLKRAILINCFLSRMPDKKVWEEVIKVVFTCIYSFVSSILRLLDLFHFFIVCLFFFISYLEEI